MSGELERVLVVGMGEVGRRLAGALAAAGVAVVPVTRSPGWERVSAERGAPVLVCVREEALAGALAALEGVAPERLVFMQNGWVRDLLAGVPSCSRGLIWFTAKGDFFRVLRASAFAGPAAPALAGALARGGIAATALDPAAFAAAEAEKMGFNCVVGLPLAVHGVSLGEYLAGRADEAEAVFAEATAVTARALGAEPSPAWWPEFRRVAEPLAFVRAAAAKALEFRNGAVLRLARGLGVGVPANERLLAAAGYRA